MRTTLWKSWPKVEPLCRQTTELYSAHFSTPLDFTNRTYTSDATLQQSRNSFGNVSRYETLAPNLKKETVATPTYQSGLEKELSRIAKRALPLSPEAQKLDKEMQAGEMQPMDTLQKAITEEWATAETIRVCLIAAKAKLNKFPRKTRAAEAMKTHTDLIKRVLVHIWGDRELWVPIVCLDGRAQEALCYLAILQGVDSYILDWISADVDTGLRAYREGYFNTDTENVYSWRSVLLKNLISAHMNLDTKNKADDALKCFFIAVEMKSQHKAQRETTPGMKRTDFMLASLGPARNNLVSMMNNGTFYRTNGKLYDRLIAFCDRDISWKASNGTMVTISDRIMMADLRLHHPVAPNTSLAMELLRDIDTQKTFAMSQHYAVPGVRRLMEQAHMLSTEQNQLDDAEWIARKYHEAFEEPVRIHRGYKSRFWKPPSRARSQADGAGDVVRALPASPQRFVRDRQCRTTPN